MNRALILAVISGVMAWVGIVEILDGNLFLGINTLAIVLICLLVSAEPLPPSVQSDGETPLASSDDVPTTVETGRSAVATDRAA